MKRILSILLVFVMLLTTLVFTLASCGEEEEVKKPNTDRPVNNNPIDNEDGDIFAERAAVSDELGEYNFNGRKLRFVGHADSEWYVHEDLRNKGNLIADAKFARNQTVENRFNFEIVTAYQSNYQEVNQWVSKTVLSGADEFDVLCSQSASAGSLVLKNLFLNWYDIKGINFDKPWWPESNKTDLSYDGKCILAVSDFNFTAISCSYCMVFNKNLANSYDMGNLYKVVMDGDWTFDYFYDLIKDVYVDSDGSGDRTVGDFYGFQQTYGYGCYLNSWIWAFDNPTVKKDADGIPTLAVKTDKINNICSAIYDLCYNTNGVYYDHENNDVANLFFQKKSIFTIVTLGSPTNQGLRNFEDEYGLLPMPKWDEHQKDYLTMSHGDHTILAVPKTAKDTDFIGVCIEALSAESYKQVVPTLYEIALKTRYLRDNESKDVLDLIIKGRTFEFGYIYGANEGFGFMLSKILSQSAPNFESYYNGRYKSARYHFKNIVRVFDKLD